MQVLVAPVNVFSVRNGQELDTSSAIPGTAIPSFQLSFISLLFSNFIYLLSFFPFIFLAPNSQLDRLCGLVIRVPGYRYRGPDSILGGNTFSEK
jgi:hypothetical protein